MTLNGHPIATAGEPTIIVSKPDQNDRVHVDVFDAWGEPIHSDKFDISVEFLRGKFLRTLEGKTGAERGSLAALDTLLVAKAREAAKGTGAETRELETITSADLHANTKEPEYIVKDCITVGEGGTLGGGSKSLKTGIGIDLGISAASGTKFLGTFEVVEPCGVGIISGESGRAALRNRAQQVCASRGIGMEHLSRLIWCTRPPILPEQLSSLRKWIMDHELGLVLLDPAYQILNCGDFSGNVFKMGQYLRPLTELSLETGVTIVLLHHFNRARAKDQTKHDPPELGDLSMAGLAEWSRFWLLVNRRQEWDEENGKHWLWLRMGGSAGHASLHAIDVTEGKRSDPGGQRWEVSVNHAGDVRRARTDEKERQRIEKVERTEGERRRRLESIMRKFPQGETARVLRDAAGLTAADFSKSIDDLLANGKAETVQVKKNGQTYDGFRLKETHRGTMGNDGENTGCSPLVGRGGEKPLCNKGFPTPPPTHLSLDEFEQDLPTEASA